MPILCLMNWLDPRGFVFQFSLKAPHLQTHSKGKFKIWFLHCNPFSFSDRIDTLDIKKFNCRPILPFQSLLVFQIHDLALCGEQILVSMRAWRFMKSALKWKLHHSKIFQKMYEWRLIKNASLNLPYLKKIVINIAELHTPTVPSKVKWKINI